MKFLGSNILYDNLKSHQGYSNFQNNFDITAKLNDDGCAVDSNTSRVTYTYPMVKETDMTEGMKADVSNLY